MPKKGTSYLTHLLKTYNTVIIPRLDVFFNDYY